METEALTKLDDQPIGDGNERKRNLEQIKRVHREVRH